MDIGKVFAVDAIRLLLLSSAEPALQITARGRTVTSGWSNGALARHFYVRPPTDGILDYDFVARPPRPGQIVEQMLTEIRAVELLTPVDLDNFWGRHQRLEGIRIIAVANEKTMSLTDPTGLEHAEGRSGVAIMASRPTATPHFESDIRELFRPEDIAALRAAGWPAASYEDFKRDGALILRWLEDGSLPADGAWPAEDIDLFDQWLAAGAPR